MKKQCKFCKSKIDSEASVCPFCRKEQKISSSIMRVIIAVLLIIAIFMVIVVKNWYLISF